MIFSSKVRLLALLVACAGPPSVFSDDPAMAKLHAFEEKLAAEQSAAAASPSRPPRDTSVTGQIGSIEAFIKRGDYDKARQAIGSLSAYSIPPDLQQDWIDLSILLVADIEKKNTEARERSRVAIDQLAGDVHQACLAAKTSADLDALLIRCGALQMQGPREQDIIAQRTHQKLSGVVMTLERWTKFLDFRTAGNAKAANAVLRDLLNDSTNFPVLTASEIKNHILISQQPASSREALEFVFKDVKTPDDLTSALERSKKLSIDSVDGVGQAVRPEEGTLQLLKTAWDQSKKGNDNAALNTLGAAQRADNFSEAKPFHDPIKQAILRKALAGKFKEYSSAEWKPDENIVDYLDRILGELQQKQNYQAMVDVIKVTEPWIEYPLNDGTLVAQRLALESFLAARRFEAASDALAALNEYRAIVGSSGKYLPVKEATEALEKLQQKHPEAFKDYEGVVLQEIRALREQLRVTANMNGRGPPIYPGPPHRTGP